MAFLDSQGEMHPTPEAASKAEFRRALTNLLGSETMVSIDSVVGYMFDIDKLIQDATRLDTRADLNPGGDAS
jgi:hypothetical protein